MSQISSDLLQVTARSGRSPDRLSLRCSFTEPVIHDPRQLHQQRGTDLTSRTPGAIHFMLLGAAQIVEAIPTSPRGITLRRLRDPAH
jgi:hypothetical protein